MPLYKIGSYGEEVRQIQEKLQTMMPSRKVVTSITS